MKRIYVLYVLAAIAVASIYLSFAIGYIGHKKQPVVGKGDWTSDITVHIPDPTADRTITLRLVCGTVAGYPDVPHETFACKRDIGFEPWGTVTKEEIELGAKIKAVLSSAQAGHR